MLHCDICNKEINPSQNETDGENDFHIKCWDEYLYNEAISHGIPRSVVDGKTSLKDHFSQEYIEYKCNKELKNETN